MRRFSISTLVAVAFLVLPAAGFAQTLFDYQLKNKVQSDEGPPMLILRARGDFIKSGSITFERSDGDKRTVKIGSMDPAQEKRFVFKQPKGTYKYRVTLKGETQHGQTMETAFETEVSYVDPIELGIERENVRVGEGKLIMSTNRPIEKVDVEVYDQNGSKVVEQTQSIGGKKGNLEINWPARTREVGAIRLRAHDVDGFWSAVVLEPFWVEIPHEEVIFDFGKATWQPEQTPKLEKTLQGIREAMRKHKKHGLNMQLYVAGYTDTVGSKAENRKLSTARAKAIARWFRKNGLKIDVYYQGFGEEVLAKPTPDETKEPANRRAIYILGNAPPPTSGTIPRSNWNKI